MRYLLFSLVVLLLGCGTTQVISVTASAPVSFENPVAVPLALPPPPPPVVLAVPLPDMTIPFRQFLYPSDGTTLGDTYSVIVFTHRPESVEDKKTYIEVCKKWLGDYETSSVVKAYAPVNVKLLPFYYPTTMTSSKGQSCDSNLYDYDYGRATVILASLKYGATAGPLLVLKQRNTWFVLDISKFQPVDVERAFIIWKSQISVEKSNKAVFSYVKFKEYFRTLVQSYGTDIIKYIPKIG